MLSSEIQKLKERLADSSQRNKENDDKLLADLSSQPGWTVLVEKIDRKIEILLELETEGVADLQFIGAFQVAKQLAIDELRGLKGEVESAKSVRVIEEESEQGA